jgi:hypothetical protein
VSVEVTFAHRFVEDRFGVLAGLAPQLTTFAPQQPALYRVTNTSTQEPFPTSRND